MSNFSKAELLALLRLDLLAFAQKAFQALNPSEPFKPNWHHQAITYQLERCLRGECKRLAEQVSTLQTKMKSMQGAKREISSCEPSTIAVPPPSGAMNYVVGSVGEPTESRYAPDEPPCFQISPDEPVTPRSVYLQQLADRLGATAVDNITTSEQRSGRIWSQLANWAGEGLLENASTVANPNPADPYCDRGIQTGDVCCSIQCGTCGGTGCGARPGGASECCVGRIQTENRSCSEGPAPCVMDTP